MFENLTEKITSIFDKLKGKGIIDEPTLTSVMREIRVALLESDVSITVAKSFIENVKGKALGQEIIKSVSPAQMVIKIVNDELTKLLGSENHDIKTIFEVTDFEFDGFQNQRISKPTGLDI